MQVTVEFYMCFLATAKGCPRIFVVIGVFKDRLNLVRAGTKLPFKDRPEVVE